MERTPVTPLVATQQREPPLNTRATLEHTAATVHTATRQVRSHFFFQYLPKGMLSRIVVLLKPCLGEVGRSLVLEGALGTAMFLIEVRDSRVMRLASSATNGTTEP